jgi:hypothetical protein
MLKSNWYKTVALASLAVIFQTESAHAYLDPGTASLVLQGIVGAVGAGLVAGGIYWRKFTGLFRKGSPDEAESTPAEPPLTTPRDRNAG